MKSLYIYMLALLLTLNGCKDAVEADIPLGKFVDRAVFQSDDLAESAARGMYATMINVIASARPFQEALSTTFSLTSDEYELGSYNEVQQLLADNNVLPTTNIVGNLWAAYYNLILQANFIYENAEQSSGLSAPVKKKIMAESRFVRAFCFFYLANIYGHVPLSLSSDYNVTALLPKSTRTEVLNQVVKDLVYARENLVGNSTNPGSRHRPTKWSATALLARTYLYQQNWTAAEEAATAVISQHTIFRLEALEDVFPTNSREAIWALHPNNSFVPDVNIIQGPATNNTLFRFSAHTLSRFDVNDQRLLKWTKTVGTTTAQYKFKTYNNAAASRQEATMVLRLAEQYLIRAEARAMQPGKLADAIKDVDLIRTRAGAVGDNTGANSTNTFKTIAFSNPTIESAELIKVIYDERIRELFGEMGHRWFDAKRATTDLATFFEGRKPGITSADAYFPIPQVELDRNPNLEPNDDF